MVTTARNTGDVQVTRVAVISERVCISCVSSENAVLLP
jgi:hypothetical protein